MVPDNLDGHRQLARTTSIPITTGENEYTRYGCRDLIRHEAASIFSPDALIVGGATEFMKVAALVQACDLALAPHSPQELCLNADGTASPPEVPGTGLDPNREALAPYRVG